MLAASGFTDRPSSERPRGWSSPRSLNLAVAVGTVLLAFGVNAVAHLLLLVRTHPLVRDHRGTLQFVSAWVGDGLLLPAMNVAAVDLLRQTGGPPRPRELAAAAVIGVGVTSTLHLYQAARGLVNWSMPRPWRWNLLGWYHFAFMTAQLSLLSLALLRLAQRPARRVALRDGLVLIGGLALFALLLRWDYRDR